LVTLGIAVIIAHKILITVNTCVLEAIHRRFLYQFSQLMIDSLEYIYYSVYIALNSLGFKRAKRNDPHHS
jgi:hypothetical protein